LAQQASHILIATASVNSRLKHLKKCDSNQKKNCEKRADNSQQDPSMAEEKFHCVIVLLQVLVELRDHQSYQFPQVLQVLVDIVVGGRANEDITLHKTDKAPESFGLVLQFTEDGSQKITHALCVAVLREEKIGLLETESETLFS
jgi:hypothetical protein